MRIFQLKTFQRMLKINRLSDTYLKNVLRDIFSGRSTSLGSKLFKVRASKKGAGKSGGYHNIFFWKQGECIIFIYLFSKNVRDNISAKESKELKILADNFDHLSTAELNAMVQNGDLMEVDYHD